MNKKLISILASSGLLLTAGIWGFSFVVVKDSLDYIGPIYMVALRYSLAVIVMSLIFVKKLKLINPKLLLHALISGLFLYGGYITQTIGCKYTTAGKNAFLTTIYVILIPFFSWIMYKKRPGWHIFLAAFLSITGIGFLSLGDSSSLGGINIGDIMTLICGVFFALHIIFTAKYNLEEDDPVLLTLFQFVTVAVFSWLLAPFYDGAFEAASYSSSRVILSILYLGLFSTMVGFTLQNVGLKYVNSSIASIFLGFESVFGILFSTIILHEAFTLKMAIGCVLIFSAVILAEKK
ncbi:MAG: DMT family transporter [Treponema sp.]|nr:DMT family transporter [Treponema sp.]